MNWRVLFLILFGQLSTSQLFGAIELGGNFSYNKAVYGENRQNKQTSRAYSTSVAFFLTRLTAIELNYSYIDDVTTENNRAPVSGFPLSVVGMKNTVNRKVYGVGLRQFFSGRQAIIRPFISLGYAKQFVTDQNSINFEDDLGNGFNFTSDPFRRRDDSIFGSGGIQWRLTQTMGLDASIHTVFKAFEFNRAGDHLRYSLGLRWLLF